MSSFASLTALLDHLETIAHAARWDLMVQVGRESVTPPSETTVQPMVVALADSNVHYERLLAAMAMRGAAAARNPLPPVVANSCQRLFLDPSKTIYNIVREPLIRTSSDDALLQLLEKCPARQFRVLTSALHDLGRDVILQTLYSKASGPQPSLQGFPASRLALLAGYMPSDDIKLLTAETLQTLEEKAVARLTLREPATVVERLVAAVTLICGTDDAPPPTQAAAAAVLPSEGQVLPAQLESTLLTVFETLTDPRNHAEVSTELALALMRGTMHHILTNDYRKAQRVAAIFVQLASRSPIPVIEYLIEHARSFPRYMRLSFSQSVQDVLAANPALMDRLYDSSLNTNFSSFTRYFSWMPTETRTHFWKTRHALFMNQEGLISSSIICCLPNAKEREAQAELMFNHKSVLSNPLARMPFVAVLPFPRAQELINEFITDPVPDVRVATIAPLIKTAQYHSEHLGAILDHFLYRKKEQDTYRGVVFDCLAGLSPSVWTRTGEVASHIGKVAQLVQAALDAMDVSAGTLASAQRVLHRLIRHDPGTVSPLLESVVIPFARLGGGSEMDTATPETARLVAAAVVRPLMETTKTKGKTGTMARMLFQYFSEHARRLWDTEFRAVADACLADTDARVVHDGLEWYVAYDKCARYAPLVASLLDREHDAILLPECKEVVAVILQEERLNKALEPVDTAALTGRFRDELITGGVPVHFITFNTVRFSRLWTARQQNAYAKTLTEAMDKYYLDDYRESMKILKRAANMPSVDFAGCLRKYALAEYESERTRSIAISIMGKMKDAASMQELITALGDTRVGDAAVAVQRRLRGWSCEDAVALLRPVLFTCKGVSVQKQLVRFIGEYGDELAYQTLKAFHDEKGTDKLHQDVRVALISAMFAFLNREEVWNFYDVVVTSPRKADVIALTTIPYDLLREPWQLARMNKLLLIMLERPDEWVQSAALQYINNNPPRLEDTAIYKVLLDNLRRIRATSIQRASLNCIFKFRNEAVDVASKTIGELEDDQSLQMCIGTIESAYDSSSTPAARARVQTLAAQVAQVLLESRRQATLIVRLVLISPYHTWPEQIASLEQQGLMHAGAQNTLISGATGRGSRAIDDLAALEASSLRSHASPLVRRVGLCVVTTVGGRKNWPEPLIEALKQYRNDEDAWVRDDARLCRYRDEFKEETANGSSDDNDDDDDDDDDDDEYDD